MHKIVKLLSAHVLLYCILTLVFTASIIGVHLIPHEAVTDNIRSSVQYLCEKGIYYQVGPSGYYRIDTYTDAIALNEAFVMDEHKPVESSMLNYVKRDSLNNDEIENLRLVLENGNPNAYYYSYSRNWNGYQIFLRPLLVLTDLQGIIIINFIFVIGLALLTVYSLWKKGLRDYAICFGVSWTVLNFFIMPLCTQYVTCISIAMIGILAILYKPAVTENNLNTSLTFFTIGAVCNFFDWLTIPQLTYGLPFIAYYMLNKRTNIIKAFLITGAPWIVAYALTLISKWTLGTLLTDYNCFELALDAVKTRTSASSVGVGVDYNLFYCVKTILGFFWGHGIVLCFLVMYTYMFIKNKKAVLNSTKENYWLLLVALLVPLWYFAMRNHSFLHFSLFAWRALFLTVVSIMMFTLLTYKKVTHRDKKCECLLD